MGRGFAGERYSRVAITLHWIIALAVFANVVIAFFARGLMGMHKAIGVTVLVLTFARIAWRLGHQPPPLPGGMTRWESAAAKSVHWLFYLLLLAMPVTGWMMASGAVRRGLSWFGLFDIPYLPITPRAAGFGHDAHGIMGYLMIALIVLHIAAALRHHWILRDATLVRMTPILRRRGP